MPQLPLGIRQGLRLTWSADFERPTGCVVRLSAAERVAAIRILQQQLAPCGKGFAAQCAAKVDAVTVSREKGAVDEQARRAVMVSALEGLPADLLAKACRSWIETEKWRPTPAELRKVIERDLRQRQVMLEALVNPKPEAPKAIPSERADPEHISKLVDRLRKNLDVRTGEPLPEKGERA